MAQQRSLETDVGRKKAAASLPVLVERRALVKGEKTSGVLGSEEFGREAVRTMLSNGDRKRTSKLS